MMILDSGLLFWATLYIFSTVDRYLVFYIRKEIEIRYHFLLLVHESVNEAKCFIRRVA